MARISRLDGSQTRTLLPEMLVGRSSLCGLRLDSADVSKEHAVIRWTDSGWELRDLDSRNGTFVSGRQLDSGERLRLELGVELWFGSNERWLISDLSPPLLRAQTDDDEPTKTVTGEQMLAIEDGEELLASVTRDSRGRWILEREGEAEQIHGGARVALAGRLWAFELPELGAATAESDGAPMILHARLRIDVGADELVWVRAFVGGEVFDLKRRSANHLVLALARARLDHQARRLPPADCGWVEYRELRRILACTRNLVNVNVHRIRKQFEDFGFADAASVIERRLSTGELRLGITELELELELPAGS